MLSARSAPHSVLFFPFFGGAGHVMRQDARRELLNFIGPNTIVIGHSLENDLCSMRVCPARASRAGARYPLLHTYRRFHDSCLDVCTQICHDKIVDTSLSYPHPAGLPAMRAAPNVLSLCSCLMLPHWSLLASAKGGPFGSRYEC